MPEATQICVGLDNKPGMFAKLCAALHSVEANVAALFVSHAGQSCWVYLVVEPSHIAESALREAGYSFFTESVLTVRIGGGSDSLEQMARTLADHGINISYVYGSTGHSDGCTLVLKVDDQARAAEVLQGAQVN